MKHGWLARKIRAWLGIDDIMSEVNTVEAMVPQRCKCAVCGKIDFIENLVELTLDQLKMLDITWSGYGYRLNDVRHIHAKCAKIKRSDDGTGWNKVKTTKRSK